MHSALYLKGQLGPPVWQEIEKAAEEHGPMLYSLKVQLPQVPLWEYADHQQRLQQALWGRHHFGTWMGGLSQEKKAAIELFKAQSDSINNFLRLDEAAIPRTVEQQRALVARIIQLETALRSVTVPQEIVVYRGIRGPFPKGLSAGQMIRDDSFMATSLLLATAEEFSCWHDLDEPDEIATILAIQIPAGHAGAWIEELADPNIREYEILLPPRTRLAIDRVDHVSSTYGNLPDGVQVDPSEPVRRIALCRCLQK